MLFSQEPELESAGYRAAGISGLRNADGARAACVPYSTQMVHLRGWRQFMEYGNGTIGDMGIHMLDTVRWMLGLGWPRTVSSSGGIFCEHAQQDNISDTQTATFDFGNLQILWQHRFWGAAPEADDPHPWFLKLYGDKGTLK